MEKKRTAAKATETTESKLKQVITRWPRDWVERVEEVGLPNEPFSWFVLATLQPILEGKFELKRDSDGRVTGFRPQPSSMWRELSPRPQFGRPPLAAEIVAGEVYSGRSLRSAETRRKVVSANGDVIVWKPEAGGPTAECNRTTFILWMRRAAEPMVETGPKPTKKAPRKKRAAK